MPVNIVDSKLKRNGVRIEARTDMICMPHLINSFIPSTFATNKTTRENDTKITGCCIKAIKHSIFSLLLILAGVECL